jgi:hypothetical protein
MTSSNGDSYGSGERLRYQDASLGQRFGSRLDVLIERQFVAVADDGRRDVIAQRLKERREQLARAVQSWQQDEMRWGVQAD